MKRLMSHETRLVGGPRNFGDRIVRDEEWERIDQLIDQCLQHIKAHPNGWEVLFRDPSDGRYWEYTYPHGEMHGGGPPSLIHITQGTAKLKYSLDD